MALFDYEADVAKFKEFLTGFYTSSTSGRRGGAGKDFKYAKQLTAIANREQVEIVVELDDLLMSDVDENDKLVENIQRNAKRYTDLISDAIFELLPDYKTKESTCKDALDVYIEHRLENARNQRDEHTPAGQSQVEAQFPRDLLRRFEVYWKPGTAAKSVGVRALRADTVGKLVTVHGTVIRASEVRPRLTVATYSCDSCSAETFQTVTGPSFSPQVMCNSAFCKSNRTGGRLQLQTRGSKFVRFQELRIQEQSNDVPAGDVPRTLVVYCRGETTRRASAGDHIAITGVFLPLAKSTAFAQVAAGLTTDTFLEAHMVIPLSKWDDGEIDGDLTDAEMAELMESDFYDKLAASIAPEVYGHDDVKKSLLLQLVGGLERHVGGLNIRGSINVCLMGDPGVAKSQLLSYIDRLAPRSQLTSGRGSTGVGLTASIMKDPVTGLMSLEAGALMLADQGICCIDEFDKMNEADRTALHEVMEQQTISVAKAGILTTLHARTSVLAAANPAYGKYNPNRSIQDNINLPAALLSRFDLLWLIQDKPNPQEDLRLAKHITYVHQHLQEPPSNLKPLEMGLMRRYIISCRKVSPTIPQSLSEKLVGAYVELRKDARDGNSRENTFTSPRSLLAILRLATALARLRRSDVVIDADVNEAIRLVERARDSTKPNARSAIQYQESKGDKVAKVVRQLASESQDKKTVKISDVKERCRRQHLTNEEIDRYLDQYETQNVWEMNQKRTTLVIV